MKKCFGIISWLPDDKRDREKRRIRVNEILQQISHLWPDIDIIIIAQNWKEWCPDPIKNKLIEISFPMGLGILKARQELRTEFLSRDYEYIIMLDDDAIICCDTATAHLEYIDEIDKHPNGFAFIERQEPGKSEIYASAQLNLCAISKYIYETEPLPDLDVVKGDGYEDLVYSHLLHYKYPQNEFHFKDNIRHVQFQNKDNPVPSTWFNRPHTHTNLSNAMIYLDNFKKGNFNWMEIKKELDSKKPQKKKNRIYL